MSRWISDGLFWNGFSLLRLADTRYTRSETEQEERSE